MKIYGIELCIVMGGDYDATYDDIIIGYYATKVLALKAFDSINLQDMLDEYACGTILDYYILDTKVINNDLPCIEYKSEFDYDNGWIRLCIMEIDVNE